MNSRFWSTASAVPRYQSRVRPRPRYGWSSVTPPRLRSRSHGRPTPMWSIRERGAYWVRTADVGQARVDHVREGEVDDPVLAAERDAGLGADLGQDRQPLTLAAGQDQGQDRVPPRVGFSAPSRLTGWAASSVGGAAGARWTADQMRRRARQRAGRRSGTSARTPTDRRRRHLLAVTARAGRLRAVCGLHSGWAPDPPVPARRCSIPACGYGFGVKRDVAADRWPEAAVARHRRDPQPDSPAMLLILVGSPIRAGLAVDQPIGPACADSTHSCGRRSSCATSARCRSSPCCGRCRAAARCPPGTDLLGLAAVARGGHAAEAADVAIGHAGRLARNRSAAPACLPFQSHGWFSAISMKSCHR